MNAYLKVYLRYSIDTICYIKCFKIRGRTFKGDLRGIKIIKTPYKHLSYLIVFPSYSQYCISIFIPTWTVVLHSTYFTHIFIIKKSCNISINFCDIYWTEGQIVVPATSFKNILLSNLLHVVCNKNYEIRRLSIESRFYILETRNDVPETK